MSLRFFLLGVTLPVLSLAGDSAISSSNKRSHPRDLKKRAEVDCGTFTMFCGGTRDGQNRNIEAACNNACFFIKVLRGGDYTATFRTDVDNTKNRKHSGCNIGSDGHSVCTWMPFSQRFGDSLSDPTCDEFPMADWLQEDFVTGTPRNALRCMERGENGAAGNQWLNFRDNKGTGLEGRTCDGAMDQPDTDYKFKIAFNLDNAAASEVQYCNSSPDTIFDFEEFYMTSFSAPNGANHFPFQPDNDNHYSIANGNLAKDLLQCHVDVGRTAGDNYAVKYYSGDTEIGSGSGHLANDGDRLTVNPSDTLYAKLAVIRTGEFGAGGTPGSKIDFEYRLNDEGSDAPLIDFKWNTESTGRDKRWTEARSEGAYCKVPNIEDAENGPRQTITCYFPCAKI